MASTSKSGESNSDISADNNLVHPLFDGKYFKIKSKDGNKVKCTCLLCKHEVSAASNATTNLYTHLKEERGKLASVNTPSADLLNTIEESAKKFKCRKDWITCDQLVIAWLLHNYATSLFERDFPNQNFVTKVDSFHATVEISGQHTRGQMIIDHKNFVAEEQNILCMREINKDMYLQYLKLAFQ